MSENGLADLTEKLKTAQTELERATEAFLGDINDPDLNARYNQAIMALDRAEDELERAKLKFKRKKY